MIKTWTFRLKPNGPVDLTVEAATSGEALEIANRTLLWGKPAGENFYAWNNEMMPRDFTAMYGVWD